MRRIYYNERPRISCEEADRIIDRRKEADAEAEFGFEPALAPDLDYSDPIVRAHFEMPPLPEVAGDKPRAA